MMASQDRVSLTQIGRVHAAVLRELVFRRRPTVDRLAALANLDAAAVRDALTTLIEQGAVVADRAGAIVAAYPLSAVPTPHLVELESAAPWANCAVDALAVPAVVGGRGRIASVCALCARRIAIEVEESSVRSSEPAGIVLAYGGLTNCGDRPALETRCPFINFFCSDDHARRWQPPESWTGRFLPLNEAVRLAVATFSRVIDVYREYRPEG